MASILEAIIAINSSAQASVDDEDYNKITWLNDTTPISEADIKSKQAELETAVTNNAYQRNRAAEYPSIKDQRDDIYNDDNVAWKAVVKVTKDKCPQG